MTASTSTLNPGTGGDEVLVDEIATVDGARAPAGAIAQIAKLAHGVAGVADIVSTDRPMPTAVYGELLYALEALRMAVASLTRTVGMAMPDASGRLRANVETGSIAVSSLPTLAAVTTVTTVTTVGSMTNQVQIGGFAAADQVPALMRIAASALRNNITTA